MERSPGRAACDDPARLRRLLDRSLELAEEHGVASVIVGLAGREGDLLVPELFDYLESALRVEDAIYRMTRERAVLFLADVEASGAGSVVQRLVRNFLAHYGLATEPELLTGFFEVPAGSAPVRLKQVLPAVFPPDASGGDVASEACLSE